MFLLLLGFWHTLLILVSYDRILENIYSITPEMPNLNLYISQRTESRLFTLFTLESFFNTKMLTLQIL